MPHSRLAALAAATLALALPGCSSMPDGSRWGAGIDFTPGWAHVRSAAAQAARDPWVWAPLAGAAVLQVKDWDHRVSRWARRETPVFGSAKRADDWSDGLRTVSVAGYAASVLATPGGDAGAEWFEAKARGAALGLGAIAVTGGVTEGLKRAAGRDRPNDRNDDSFPSGHASTAAVFETMTARNLQDVDMDPRLRTGLEVADGLVTAGTAWGRVEAGEHYPSDVLVGVALGNFVGHFVDAAFLDRDRDDGRLAFSAEPVERGAVLRVVMRF